MSSLSLELAESVHAIPEDAWDALLGDLAQAPPFLRHAFLATLEDAGTVGGRRGAGGAVSSGSWIPRFLLVRRGPQLVGAAPAYLKLDSQGEFVFDFAFAELAGRMGVEYYPKLLVAVPFTPVTGARLLVRPGEERPPILRLLAQGLCALAEQAELSGVHVNFALEDEVQALVEQGFVERHGIQYHWMRREARSFEDYLARFNSKRRNQIRRELKELEAQGLEIVVRKGGTLSPDELRSAFDLYKTTVDKFVWGRQYLNQRFFELAAARLPQAFELVLAQPRGGGAAVAGAINFASGRRLYGRYWGAHEERRFLHFNVCYYRGVEECCDRQLEVFEPGAGGEHKLVRGFEPTIQRSAHWFRDARLLDVAARSFARERVAVAAERAAMMEALGLRKE